MKSARIATLVLSQVMMVQFCLAGSVSKYSKSITQAKPDRHWSFDSFLPAKNVEASSQENFENENIQKEVGKADVKEVEQNNQLTSDPKQTEKS